MDIHILAGGLMIRSPYSLLLGWMMLMAFFARYVETTRKRWIFGRERNVTKWWFAILVFIPLLVMAANRQRGIGDTGMYINTYSNMPGSFSGIPAYYSGLKKDKAYYLLAAVIKCIFGSDHRIYFLIIAGIQSFGLLKLYRKHSPSFMTAIFLFVASTDYVSWMQNGTRQFVAVSICLLAADWMMQKKYIPAVITVLIASRFHQSALLVIPMIFIAQGEPWNFRTLVFIALTVLAIVYVEQFTTFLDEALEETQYTNVVTEWQRGGDDGTNPLRVLVYSLPAILSLIGLRFLRQENDVVINFAANMSIITAGLYLVSMVTSGIFIGRLPIYASLYSQGILLPWEVDHMFNKESTSIVKVGMVVFYVMFYIYQIHRWGYFGI